MASHGKSLGWTAWLLLALLLAALAPHARADLAKGRDAYRRGDYARAYWELMPAAQAGNAEAEYLIGEMSASGHGMPRSYAVAARWYALAAKGGYEPAFMTLGLLYLYGAGDDGDPTAIAADPSQAAPYIRQAADSGDKNAQALMGELYLKGEGVPPDPLQAHQYIIEAAARGVVGAQFNAGLMSLRGTGTEQDPVEAYKWFSLAAAEQYPGAEQNRQNLARSMTPQQLERAQELVKSFAPAP